MKVCWRLFLFCAAAFLPASAGTGETAGGALGKARAQDSGVEPIASHAKASRLTGDWVWIAGGRPFATVHIAKDTQGRFSGWIERPAHFNLRSDLAVDGVTMPLVVQQFQGMRFEGSTLRAWTVATGGSGARVEWLLSSAERGVLEMRLAATPAMPPIRLTNARGHVAIATDWDPARPYEWGWPRRLLGQSADVPIGAPPASLKLDPFYQRYVDAGGVAVVASDKAPDSALRIAREIVMAMLAHRPDLKANLVQQRARIAVMAAEEGIADLPENRAWKKPARDDPRLTQCELKNYNLIEASSDRGYWNARSRGTGGGLLTAVGAENLLGRPGDRYFGENILVHEFAHTILDAIAHVDPKLYAAVGQAYAHAQQAGLWKGDYASVTVQEYWAEGTQFWFNDNKLARLQEAEVVSDRDLRRYDPQLWGLLRRVYGSPHRIDADVYYKHPARLNVPLGYQSSDC